MKFIVNNNLAIKVAQHIKIPYADNILNAFRQKDISYRHIQNTMYRIACKDYVSYFYVKDSLINYYRRIEKNEGTFLPNTTRKTYKFIEFKENTQDTKKPSILLAKSIKKDWYIIATDVRSYSKKQDIIITNDEVSDNIRIEHIKLDPNMLEHKQKTHIVFDYPTHNDILVFLHYTAKKIILYFINISEKKSYSISWDLQDISNLVFDIISNADDFGMFMGKDEIEQLKHKISGDNMVEIQSIELITKQYLYATCLDNKLYVQGIRLHCMISLKGNKYNYIVEELYIYIMIQERSLKCYWDFNNARIKILIRNQMSHTIYNIWCEKYLQNPILLHQEHKISLGKNCNGTLYNSNCYYIMHSQNKKEIMKTGSWIRNCEIACMEHYSIYYYKNYYILISKDSPIKLAIADKENNFIGIRLSQEFFPEDIKSLLHFEYYYSLSKNKLVFLSDNSIHLFFIDTNKIDDIFNKGHKSRCKETYDDQLGLAYYFFVPRQLVNAIEKVFTDKPNNILIGWVESYIDRESDNLYIAAEYEIKGLKYLGLFMWDMRDNSLSFKLLYTILASKAYNNHKKNSIKYILDMSKLMLWKSELHKSRKNKLIKLDLFYSKSHRFISMKYNRISRYIPVPNVFQFVNYPCEVKTVKNIERDLVVVYYDCSRSYPNAVKNAYFYFILSSISLVRKIPTVII